MNRRLRSTTRMWWAVFTAVVLVSPSAVSSFAAAPAAASHAKVAARPSAVSELDCNGDSPVQRALRPMLCTDIRGFDNVDNANTWGGKFYDNGVYIGHDEPDATFLSSTPGSGKDVTWNMRLGVDPAAAPTDNAPGHDVSHYFELTPAPWLSMAICDPSSYPQLPCTPGSDANAPACDTANCNPQSYPGAGSAFMEMQFYPPGNPPFLDSESCDGTHWCAALTIDSLECTYQFAQCNPNCEEPVNFAFIQTNGVPDSRGAVPDAETLLMNPGDRVTTHIYDAPAPGGKALKVVVDDLTTHTSGFMQASAANGFVNHSIVDCSASGFNFEPEYSTASRNNTVPWAALRTDISTEFETGHFEACTKLTKALNPFANPYDPSDPNGRYQGCVGPYESSNGGKEGAETGDAMCYRKGDTHPGYAGPFTSTAPDEITGCQDNVYQNGDLDFDGSPYWPEWPTSTSPGTYPGSFIESMPATGGHSYQKFFFQTDVGLSESTCTPSTQGGCTVPPAGPGHFYPYWSQQGTANGCALLFGNVSHGVNDFGRDAQFGTNQEPRIGYPEFEGPTHPVNCASSAI